MKKEEEFPGTASTPSSLGVSGRLMTEEEMKRKKSSPSFAPTAAAAATAGTAATDSANVAVELVGGASEMSQAIMAMVRPALEKMDEQVKSTRKSQLHLATNIEQLSTKLKSIVDEKTLPYELDVHVRKLEESRRRVNAVSQRLQGIHGRLSQLQRNIVRETHRQRQQGQQ